MQIAGSKSPQRQRVRLAAFLIASAAMALLPFAPAVAATLDQVKASGKLLLGYRADARPFSYDEGGKAAGYTVALCEKVAETVKTELGLSAMTVEWVPVTLEDRFSALRDGKIDILCGADTATLERRKEVSFSIPIFPSGIGAILRRDAPAPLREVLAGKPAAGPVWRGSPARILNKKTFSVVKGTTGEKWLAERMQRFHVDASVSTADSYDAGIQQVLEGNSDVFFGDRPILLEAATGGSSASELILIDRLFTNEPLAIAMERGDEDLRLIVDRTLSRLFRSGEFRDLYAKWFGEPDDSTLAFYLQNALPE
ncbi:MAG TPA: amino acid ABC transporter substrate-binding protein [Verrucomicrobiae bacterium]|nr:amino acid ABC transporter substrate-binding protein [Verrucomicrobiae bacterium]